MQRFAKELLRDERKTVGRYDGRLEGSDSDAAGETPEYDPSYSSVQGPFTAAFNQYVRSELKFDEDIPYEVLTDRVRPWDSHSCGPFKSVPLSYAFLSGNQPRGKFHGHPNFRFDRWG